MATIEQIDKTRPMFFAGNRTVLSDDPELIALSKMHDNQRMRLVSGRITDEIVLTPTETALLMNYVGDVCWREEFDRNLQSLAAMPDGDLLSGWMPIDTFLDFVDNAGDGDLVRDVLNRLQSASDGWKSDKVDEVYFDGYVL